MNDSIYEYLSKKINTDSSYDFWYNFGRKCSKEEFKAAWVLINNSNDLDDNIKSSYLLNSLTTKKKKILYYLFNGSLRENKLDICEEAVDDLRKVTEYHVLNEEVYIYATTNKARSFIIKQKECEDKHTNLEYWFRKNTIVGKCRSKPLQKIQKVIDKIKDIKILEKCLFASAENLDVNVFEYIYQKSLDFDIDLRSIESDLFIVAFEEKNGALIDRLMNKVYPDFFKYTFLSKDKETIKNFIEQRNNINMILLSKKLKGGTLQYIPNGMYTSIIQKMLYPKNLCKDKFDLANN